MGLSGRNAMVTGGASGIGRAICLRLARDGADVAVLDLDQAGGRQVADEVAALHRRAVAVEADVASGASVAAAVERVHAALGPVHVLVNDAGIAGVVALQDMTEDEWDRMIAVHMRSEEHTSELQSRSDLVCRLLLEKKKKTKQQHT